MVGANLIVNNAIFDKEQTGKTFNMKVDPLYQEKYT